MSQFFKPVEFKVEADPDLPRTTTTVWDKEKIAQADKDIKAEVEALKAGTSKYSVYAIDPGKHGFPAMNALKRFLEAPGDKTLEVFAASAVSTWGARAGNEFTAKLRACSETREV